MTTPSEKTGAVLLSEERHHEALEALVLGGRMSRLMAAANLVEQHDRAQRQLIEELRRQAHEACYCCNGHCDSACQCAPYSNDKYLEL